ncbi:MAG: alpha/beta hydrolase [Solirubrobacteraceae bacterium]
MRTRSTPAALAAVLACTATAPAAHAAIAFSPCSPAGFECGTLGVPLDRTGAVPGTVTLSVQRAVVSSNPTRSAVVGLAGGPGQAAIPVAQDFAKIAGAGLASRDLLVFDQRGTGASGRLRCDAFEQPSISTVATVAACAQELGAARGLYRTADSVDDLEQIRQEAGYDKLVLVGVSYGTKVALDYAARYPAHVESLVLDSVVPPEGSDPLNRSSLQAVGPVLADACRGGACRHISANPLGDVSRLVRRMVKRPLRGTVNTPRGHTVNAVLTPGGLFDILLAGDLNPTLRAEFPGSVHGALRGDNRPILRLLARAAGLTGVPASPAAARLRAAAGEQSTLDSSDSSALFAATRCEETPFPWVRAASPQARAAQAVAAARALPRSALGAFTYRVALTSEAIPLCVGWPDASPAPAAPGPLPQVPTLILDGASDVRTPVADAQSVAGRIPGAQLVPVPYVGHSVLGSDFSGCAQAAVSAFLSGRPVAQCDPAKGRVFAPTPVAPTRLSTLPGRTKALKTVAAAAATVVDVRRQFIGDEVATGRATRPGDRAAGLRAGTALASGSGFRLRSVQYVPGVAVSGFVSGDKTRSVTLTIRGPAAAPGRITVAPSGAVTGRLGSLRVHVRPSTRAASLAPGRGWNATRLRFPGLVR